MAFDSHGEQYVSTPRVHIGASWRIDGAAVHRPLRANADTSAPEVWVLAQRGLSSVVVRGERIEFEDLVVDLTGGDLIAPQPGIATMGLRRLSGAAGRRLRLASRFPTGMTVDDPGGECDLLVDVCSHQSDLRIVNALPNWTRRAAAKVLWLEDVDHWPAYTELMSQFDLVVVSSEQSVQPVAELTGTTVRHLPFGIDALAFCPWPDRPQRFIDVMNVGRCSAVTHCALMERPDLFWHFDTTMMAGVRDPHEHRAQYHRFAQRSRYFVVNRAKFTCADSDAGTAELGLRFFEGAAAGAVLIGDHPKTPTFDEHFGWQDSVIHQTMDALHIADVIDDLDLQPQRLEGIRRRNVSEFLSRHDWSHRFDWILDHFGLARPEPLDQLAGMARAVAG